MITEDLDTFSLIMFRLQLRVLALFHVPVLGAALRLTANKLMRINIFLSTYWEQWILQVNISAKTWSSLLSVGVLF